MKQVIIDGIKFTRDKKTGYYLSATPYDGKAHIRLHVYVWQKAFGEKLKPGYQIHHKDFNKENNNPDNLVCLTIHDHLSIHARLPGRQERARKNFIANAHPAAAKWHGSAAGRAWHRAQYQRMKAELHKPITATCEYCGKTYTHKDTGNNRFCSNACKSAWRRKSGLDDVERICANCGQTFRVNKYSKARCCCRKCAMALRFA